MAFSQARGRKPGKKPTDPLVRFDRHTVEGGLPPGRPELGPCLIYTGATNGGGYGQFRYKGDRRNGYAHRFAWEQAKGPIPDGLTIDHLCRVRNCVRVGHMELVDSPTNTRRAAEARTHCNRGHAYTDGNIYVWRGKRYCRECRRANYRGPRSSKLPSESRARKLTPGRSGGDCEVALSDVCLGRASNLHHRRARSQGGTWAMSNILHVCGSGTTGCHGVLTDPQGNRSLYERNGWIVKGFTQFEPADIPVLMSIYDLETDTVRKVLAYLDDEGERDIVDPGGPAVIGDAA